jgi:hypothetical protein
MRAVRRLGELMARQKAAVGLNKGGTPMKQKSKSTGVSNTPVETSLPLVVNGGGARQTVT